MVSKMIDFSIIIPHYNIPECLERLICSIPQKDNLEIIVVDDKSDTNLDLLERCRKRYENENCRFYKNNTEHKGAGICRNIGIKKARGKWLLFADSDDFFTDNMYDIISGYRNSEADLIFFFPSSIDLATGLESDRHIEFCDVLSKYIIDPNLKNELTLRYQVVSPWSKIIRKSMIEENDIDFEGTRVANDVMFCRKIGHFSKKIIVDERTIYVVTQRPGSLITLIGKDAYNIRLDVFIRGSKYIKSVVDKDTWKLIDVNGSYYLHMCRVNKLGMRTMFVTMLKCVVNGIRPF